jgi:hypothetical protein
MSVPLFGTRASAYRLSQLKQLIARLAELRDLIQARHQLESDNEARLEAALERASRRASAIAKKGIDPVNLAERPRRRTFQGSYADLDEGVAAGLGVGGDASAATDPQRQQQQQKQPHRGCETVTVKVHKPVGTSLGFKVKVGDGAFLFAHGQRFNESLQGMLRVGDFIKAVNGEDITALSSMVELKRVFEQHEPDLVFTLVRRCGIVDTTHTTKADSSDESGSGGKCGSEAEDSSDGNGSDDDHIADDLKEGRTAPAFLC